MKLRAMPSEPSDDIFVAHDDGSFTCSDCTPTSLDLGDPDVEVWEVGSRGWTGPVVCRDCKLSIEVYVDGRDETNDTSPATATNLRH